MQLTQAKYISNTAPKIISLVPSQTELLFYLGLTEEVIGITKFCIHPSQWFSSKTKIGGTKNLNIELIRKLKPTLIIANKEENVKEQIQHLSNEFDVWVTDVNTFSEALSMIADIGVLAGKTDKAAQLIRQIQQQYLHLNLPAKKIPCIYLIWKKPYMTVGGDTFINSMMEQCGLQNIYSSKGRYPEISIDEIKDTNCSLLLLSSEPYPFKQKDADELQKSLPGTKIILVDGEMFSWYGSRLLLAHVYFVNLRKSL